MDGEGAEWEDGTDREAGWKPSIDVDPDADRGEWKRTMSVMRRELAFVAERPGASGGDWWHLVFDPEVPGIYVEHTWSRTNALAGGETPSGMERYGINDFLTLARTEAARSALMLVLSEMFPERTPTQSQAAIFPR
jgi:hypothetical protein